jgi:putative lipoic acid-binding regulatory protein
MHDQAPPKIEFPCAYPIKVVGDAAPDFREFVIETVQIHAPGLDIETITINESRNGRFVSVRMSIVATGEAQLKSLFEDLKASGRVHMVL